MNGLTALRTLARGDVHDYLRAMVRGYLDAALWVGYDYRDCEPDGDPEPLDASYSRDDITLTIARGAVRDCRAFYQDARAAGDGWRLWSPEQFGHDFCLTRNRHGAGFWDRGYGAAGEQLTRLAHPYGTATLVAYDDDSLTWEG